MRVNLQTKLMFLTSIVLAAILSGFALVRYALERRETAVFQNEARVSERFFDQIVMLHGSSLRNLVKDYSFWDEMVNFLRTRDRKWAADNIVTGLATFKADVAWVYTPDFTLVYSTDTVSAPGLSELPIPRDAIKELFKNDHFCFFFAETPLGLMKICGASIHPTFDNQRMTPPRGYFFVGRLWTAGLIDELSKLTDFNVSLGPIPPGERPGQDRSAIRLHRPVPGWDGKPLTFIHADRPRPIFGMLKLDARRQIAMYFLSALTLLGLSSFFVMRWVTRPLGLISRSLDAENPELVRVLRRDPNEFGYIANLIERFFSQRVELVQEILERKRAEGGLRKLSLAVEQSPMAVVITDTWGRIEYVNPAFARITGYSPEEVVGLNPRVLKSGAHPPEYYKAMWDVLMAGGVWRDEICNKKKSGELYWEYAEIAPVRDAAGCVTHYVAVKEDMTERRRVAEELRRAKEAAVAANGAKSLFLANMSHEIRTPMNAILGFSQLMRRDPSLNPGQKQNLDIVIRSGEHLMELINDILEISKIEAGRVTLNTAAFDLRDMLKTLDPMFRLRAEAKRLKFTVSVADGVPRRIAADEHKLKQVLINLLGNAVKFTQRGSVALAVRIEEDSKGGRRIVAEVTDTGPGISPEDMGLLFRTFEQTRVGREAATGTGLGLAISRQYAQLMGGDITVDSRVGEGSVFRFHMALHEGDPSGATAKTKTRRVTGLAVGRPALRVLVVEDEADEGRLLSRILSSTGFEVHLAAGGEDGVRDFEAWRPSLVLMDLIMSGTDGYEAIRRIRSGAGGKGVKILAVSASAFEESRRKAMAAGADDFVSKPFLDEELYEKIGSHLGVSCVYTEKVVSAGEEPGVRSELSPDAVAALPRDLVRDLRGAAFKGDFDLVVELIGRVEPIDVRLALGLRELAGRYDSPRLVDLLSEAPRAEPGESSAPRGGEGSRGKIT